jgi:glycosyltransferase involved in cell wall biosynthesis
LQPELSRPIHLLAIVEATSITGPVKNLLQFAELAYPRIQLTIATFSRPGDPTTFLDAAQALPIRVETIPERGRFDPEVTRRLRELATAIRPDLLQTHAVKSHFLVRRAKLPELTPWIAFHHGYTWPNWYVRIYNQLDRWSLHESAQIVTVSQSFRQQLEGIGISSSRIEVLGNAINPAWSSQARKNAAALKAQWGVEPQKPVILIVGRLSAEKDHLTLLEALAKMHRAQRVAPHLIAVGEGPERARIEAHLRSLQLAPHVTLTGQVPTAEPFYAWADVAVLSSRTEGSPNALLEAMAARVPVVATHVGGIPEMVAHRATALLVEPGDSSAMAEALEQVLTNPALAESLSRAARHLAETRYAPEARADQLENLYRRVLQRSQKPSPETG